jgi:hypothetical protein
MPRTARGSVGGFTYHVLNPGNGRAQVFRIEMVRLSLYSFSDEPNASD